MSPERWAINRDSVLDAAWCATLGGCITANSEEELAKRASDDGRSTDREALREALAYELQPCRVSTLGPENGWAALSVSKQQMQDLT